MKKIIFLLAGLSVVSARNRNYIDDNKKNEKEKRLSVVAIVGLTLLISAVTCGGCIVGTVCLIAREVREKGFLI